MVITRDWLDQCASPDSGGYTSAQFEVLRVAGLGDLVCDSHGMKRSGWKDRILGRELDDALAFRFYEFRTQYKTKTMNRKAKEQGDGNLSLF